MHPIIAGVGSLVERVCIWLDNLLQPLVQRVPGHIKDTKELLKTLYDFEWKNHYTWVACDVVALYTFIPPHLALTALSFHQVHYSNYSSTLKQYMLTVTKFFI